MTESVTIVEANRPRAERIAALLVPRIIDAKLDEWAGYESGERLEGVLETHNTLRYQRAGRPGAILHMGFVSMIDMHEESRHVTRNSVETQHERKTVKFAHAIEYETTLTHKWEKSSTMGAQRLRTWSEQAKSAWEASAKASLSAGYGGITGSIELAGKYGEDLTRQQGGQDTETASDTESESKTESERLKFTGPIEFTYDAVREIISETALIRVRCDFDAKIYFQDKGARDDLGLRLGGTWEWTTFRTQLVPAARGLAPENPEGSAFASAAPSTYEMFRRMPVPAAELEALAEPANKVIECIIPYDRVANDSLTIV